MDHPKQKIPKEIYNSALLTTPKPLPVWITTKWKILKEMGIPDHLTCLLRNLYAGQEATVRTGQPEWLRSKNLQVINAGEGVEKREPSHTVGGNAN